MNSEENENENQVYIKLCKICYINDSATHKFRGRSCIKCLSKKNNSKLNENNYYKKYYMEHRAEEPLIKKKSGRPRKVNLTF